MHYMFHIGNLDIPGYSLMIFIGILTANGLAALFMWRHKIDMPKFFLLELYAVIGAALGGKAMYLITSASYIRWDKLGDTGYLLFLIRNGFGFYGALIGAFIFMLIAGRIHKIDAFYYMSRLVFIVPWMHAFARIGCFCGGCCYGIPYEGPFAVVFPEDTGGLAGVPLFPVQLLESAVLFIIALVVFMIIRRENGHRFSIGAYLIGYGVARFGIEYLRYDRERGFIGALSVSQWISIAIFIVGVVFIIIGKVQDAESHRGNTATSCDK